MNKETNTYRHSFIDSVGAGAKSIFLGSKKTYYILEHKIGSKYHRTGEYQHIIVDQIEIGRAPTCQVRFDEIFETVSRRHAAIVREDNRLKLIALSQTNPTLLNGHKIENERSHCQRRQSVETDSIVADQSDLAEWTQDCK